MNGWIVYLATAAATLALVHSLRCYTCDDYTASKDCSSVKNCSVTTRYCKTAVKSPGVGYPFNGNEEVRRVCAESCEQTDEDTLGNDGPTFCCNSDLCNNRGLYSHSNSLAAAVQSLVVPILTVTVMRICL
ncbi:secreted Ly-6/uPAR-related protein 1-like [Xenopus tropicalis]|uniref:Secreted Ly-6/uPAR-related protein 1-like n=1 Tax=Xenopus tropicalis TaxID=8364 RepID=A0A8J1JRA3_XENTR|nr:secreted Ly-6/uPAR-related protein 1-like [Xenopus tropicalis]